MSQIGHNNPPSAIETASAAGDALSAWMAENPAIISEEQARSAKPILDRAKEALKSLEEERDKKVRPLNNEVTAINESYRAPRTQLEKISAELVARITKFLREEEARRQEEARKARAAAEEAEREAREKIQAEQDAISNAAAGELEIDVKKHVVETDEAITAANKLAHVAAIAQKDSKVRIAGGFGRAVSLKNKKILILVDPAKALAAIGCTEKVREALLSAARDWKRLKGALPEGVIEDEERSV